MEIAEKKSVKKRAGETNIETFMTIYQCAFHLRFHLDMWHNEMCCGVNLNLAVSWSREMLHCCDNYDVTLFVGETFRLIER